METTGLLNLTLTLYRLCAKDRLGWLINNQLSEIPICHLLIEMSMVDDYHLGTYLVETTTSWKLVQTTAKKSSKFTKKITHVDDMMIHNLVKYLVQTRLLLRDIYKNNKFLTNHLDSFWLEICYFYISQTKSSLEKIILQGCVSIYHLHVWFFWWI